MCARALLEDGNELSIVSLLDSDRALLDGFRARTCNGLKPVFAAWMHVQAFSASHFLYDVIGLARAHPRLPLLHRDFAVWLHGLEAWEQMRKEHRAALQRARLALVTSHYTLERHQASYSPLPTARVCWLATEQDDPPARLATFTGPPTVLLVGRIEAGEGRKGHAELLECWPAIVSAEPRARLVFAGAGSGLAAIQQRARASPAAANIDVLGFVPEAALPELFARAHVFAMPSRQEGFGISYVEAFRYGVPVIASTHDAGQEVNVDGQTGFNMDLARRGDLGERLIQLLRNTDLAAALGRAGHLRWQQHFRYSAFARRFLDHWHVMDGQRI